MNGLTARTDGRLAPPQARSRARQIPWAGLGIASFVLALLAAVGTWLLWPVQPETATPRIGPAITAVYASGNVEPSVMLPVAPRIGGRLMRLESDEHAQVRKGQVLARLEDEDLAGNIAQLEAQVEAARGDYTRYGKLLQDNAVARQTYDHAVSTLQAAEAAVRQARAQAGYMVLRAPADCQVISRDGEIGQFIAINTPIFWLSCHSQLRISAEVDEEDISKVAVGQNVLIRADAFPGRTFEGKVSELTPKGDAVRRSYRVRIALPADMPLQIGMTAETNIIVSQHPRTLLLPASAVTGNKIWKIMDGKPVLAAIQTGAHTDKEIEVLAGLSADDRVLRDAAAGPPGNNLQRLWGRR